MRKYCSLLLIAVLTLWLAGTAVLAHDEEGPLEGVYEFVRVDGPQGPQEGEKGMLIVKGNYVCHIRVSKDRQSPSREDTAEQRMEKAGYRFANSTCGTFKLEGDKVLATWTVSVQPGAEGNTTEYVVTQEGDTLKLSTEQAPQFQFVYKRLD